MSSAVTDRSSYPWYVSSEEWRQLKSWILVWLLLANAPFMGLLLIGGPPRTVEILVFAAVGILVRSASLQVRFSVFVLLFAYAVTRYICDVFAIDMGSLVSSVELLEAMNPRASIEYEVAAAAVIATVIGAGRLLKRNSGFQSPRVLMMALAGASLLASADKAATWHNRGSYDRAAPDAHRFESGVNASGLLNAAGQHRNILIVVVEALGQPKDPRHLELLLKPWTDPRVRRRYSVTHGKTAFFGSTTNAEMRELCGRWGNYFRLLEETDRACLPHVLRKAGYETTAAHSFTGEMFDRSVWYPNVGFERMIFSEELKARGARSCKGVFPGACDVDVPRLLAAELKAATKPQFLYWLTVNSHLPLGKVDGRCHEYSSDLAEKSRMSCRLFRIYDGLAQSVLAEIVAEDFPPTDILLVGDHMPPFFDRWNRSQFETNSVPWILLKHRDAGLD